MDTQHPDRFSPLDVQIVRLLIMAEGA
jgi:hypothetical protein